MSGSDKSKTVQPHIWLKENKSDCTACYNYFIVRTLCLEEHYVDVHICAGIIVVEVVAACGWAGNLAHGPTKQVVVLSALVLTL